MICLIEYEGVRTSSVASLRQHQDTEIDVVDNPGTDYVHKY